MKVHHALLSVLTGACVAAAAAIKSGSSVTSQATSSNGMPENCCTLAPTYYKHDLISEAETCTPSTSDEEGTLGYKCTKGEVVYNGVDLEQGVGEDQVQIHIHPDRTPNGGQFTVAMSCTAK